jgi:hypothetical protein
MKNFSVERYSRKEQFNSTNQSILSHLGLFPVIVAIICFKIKNPPTLHSTLKIQPTTSPIFVFSVSASVRKKWGYERKLLDSRFGRSSSCFFILILLFHSKGMIGTFLYIIIILCYVKKLNSSISNYGGR